MMFHTYNTTLDEQYAPQKQEEMLRSIVALEAIAKSAMPNFFKLNAEIDNA